MRLSPIHLGRLILLKLSAMTVCGQESNLYILLNKKVIGTVLESCIFMFLTFKVIVVATVMECVVVVIVVRYDCKVCYVGETIVFVVVVLGLRMTVFMEVVLGIVLVLVVVTYYMWL